MSKNCTTFSIRIPNDLKDKLQLIADKEHRSLNNLIVLLLINYLETTNDHIN